VQQAGRSGYRVLEGNARATLAGVELARGAGPRSIEQAELALAAHRETGHRAGQAQALAILRQARRATG
jgi:DNA-binding TFAR19-related protein (PDSD5 family)